MPDDKQRRQFIKRSLGAGVLISSTGFWLATSDKTIANTSLRSFVAKLHALPIKKLASSNSWSVGQTLSHCAQSVEMSMTGYPEHKSAIFKQTLGQLAISIFSNRGNMTHNLTEGIPGTSNIDASTSPQQGLQRLVNALRAFEKHQGPLQPHFAYGELTQQEYQIAHILHINDHLDALLRT